MWSRRHRHRPAAWWKRSIPAALWPETVPWAQLIKSLTLNNLDKFKINEFWPRKLLIAEKLWQGGNKINYWKFDKKLIYWTVVNSMSLLTDNVQSHDLFSCSNSSRNTLTTLKLGAGVSILDNLASAERTSSTVFSWLKAAHDTVDTNTSIPFMLCAPITSFSWWANIKSAVLSPVRSCTKLLKILILN